MIDVISVRFRSGSKTYYFDPKNTLVRTGDDVIVETSQGLEFAKCVYGNHAVEDTQVIQPLRPLIRVATDNDRRTAQYNQKREEDAFAVCQKRIAAHGLEMKLVRVECSFDGSKILFFFTADGRVDFRELVKDLASVFRSRIELRQIGVRDEAKMLGGLGICGRPFCCNQFMDDFMPVSIKMAKTQNLSLNPSKISGTCGRLMCCLKYEQDAYEDAIKRMPKNDSFVMTPDGPGNVSNINLLKENVTVRLDEHPESPRCYHNCEVCVLRNGKGSRDGIEIPQERPERYVEEQKDEPDIPDLYSIYGEPDTPAAPEQPKDSDAKPRSSRRRNSRRSKEDTPAEQGSKPSVSGADKKEKQERKEKQEKKADAKNSEPRRRTNRRGKGESPRQNTPKSKAATPAAPSKQSQNAPSKQGSDKGSDNGTARGRRPHRRGGRRRSSGAPQSGTSASEE